MAPLPQPISHTASLIDDAFVRAARNGDSMGVPMSSVANPCLRALWYAFRWAAEPETADGARERRFATGEIYEGRLLDMLRMIGCTVVQIDEATGVQMRVDLAHGHLRGKLDGEATGLPEAPATVHVVECKTANDKSFKAIIKGPVRETKPDHYAQVQLYMHARSRLRGLYMVVNKNTEELHVERVEYDPTFCATVVDRIERVVTAERPLPRLHEDPDTKGAIECKWCRARGVCHEGAFPRLNCRTCLFSSPQDGPRWRCEKHARPLTYGDMQAGCADHLLIPDLVPGEQIDADPDAGTVTYRMRDGSEWIDGRAA